MCEGDPTTGDAADDSDGHVCRYSFDFKFVVEFSIVSEDVSYKNYALAAWNWQKTNIDRYKDGNQATLYNHFVSMVGHGGASWAASDYALAAWKMGDASWAQHMASVIHSDLTNIMSAT